MKRILFLLIMLATTTIAGNAQFFVEGSVGVAYEDEDLAGSTDDSSLGIKISPKLGYWLNDNIAVGTRISLAQYISKDMITDPDDTEQKIERKYSVPEWNVSAFVRYKLWGTEKLSLLVDGSIGIGGSRTKEKTGLSVSKKVRSSSMFGISIFPAVSYNLTKKFSIITTCDFLSLGFSSETEKDLELDRKNKYNHFGFNTQSTFFKSLADISIGFIYNF